MEESKFYGEARSTHHNIDVGRRGEEAVCMYLEREGVEILERNWSCPFGEADIVAYEDGWLVFVEVKTRSGDYNGLPEEAVTPEKRQRYEAIALAYLRSCDLSNVYVRFDVASVTLVDDDRGMLRYHRNAFGVGD